MKENVLKTPILSCCDNTGDQVAINTTGQQTGCCSSEPDTQADRSEKDGLKNTVTGVRRTGSDWDWGDIWGTLKVRLSIKRMNYKVSPGLYALGNPTAESHVFVSANFKLSFDILRRNLRGLDAWILVLDTKGINVWCAAGKGTFGTDELIRQIQEAHLDQIVKHRKVIVPQLGAPGIAAHEVKRETGFTVRYGPVRASDIKAYLDMKLHATEDMRLVRFTLYDRLILTPIEIVNGSRKLFLIMIFFFLLSGFQGFHYSILQAIEAGSRAAFMLLLAFFAGSFLGPVILPWLPGRDFSSKGLFAGVIVLIPVLIWAMNSFSGLEVIAWILLVPALASFITMNFTGSSTYTSLSGVRKEMRAAVPLQFSAAGLGLMVWFMDKLI